MLGMMNKGGGSQMNQMGQNSNLAGLFRNNQPTGPAAPPTQIPPIMAPQRPTIGMPPQSTFTPQTQGKPIDPNQMFAMAGGQMKPAWMTSMVQQTGRPTTRPTTKQPYMTFRNR